MEEREGSSAEERCGVKKKDKGINVKGRYGRKMRKLPLPSW